MKFRRTLLIVDDHEDFLKSAVELLEADIPDLDVVTEKDPIHGLDRVRAGGVDAIVADLRMPGLDGIEFLEECAKIAPAAPRMLVTAYPPVKYGENEKRAHADIMFQMHKPMDPDALVRAVRALLGAAGSNGQ